MSKMFPNCSDCICYTCLYYWSARCRFGGCYDEYRARYDPYPAHHMADPPRKQWSDWNLPGEQKHWCRGGSLYPAEERECDAYVLYEGQRIEECLKSNVAVFQDGYISCSLIDSYGCRKCYEEFEMKAKAL